MLLVGFSCTSYASDKTLRLVGALDVVCYAGIHLQYLLLLAAPTGILFIFGLPALATWKQYSIYKSGTMDDDHTISTYGFLYEGYRPAVRWFWELIILIRKLSVSAIAVLMNSVDGSGRGRQGLLGKTKIFFLYCLSESYIFDIKCMKTNVMYKFAGIFVFVVSLAVHLVYKPYENPKLHMAEGLGLAVSAMTFYIGLWSASGDEISSVSIFFYRFIIF